MIVCSRVFKFMMFLIEVINKTSKDRVYQVYPHWHNEVEILYVTSGSSRQQIGNINIDMQKNDILIISSGQIHSCRSEDGLNYDCKVFMFDIGQLLPAIVSTSEKSLLSSLVDNTFYFSFNNTCEAIMNNLLDCLKAIYNEYNNRSYLYEWIIRAKLFEFLTIVLRNRNRFMGEENYNNREFESLSDIKKTLKYIEEHFMDEITLSEAARSSNLSVSRFCRQFKAITGLTFNEYLNLYRVDQARKMLSTRKSMTEIAMECGFGSLNSFLRNFKRYTNSTPSEYKKEYIVLSQL